MAARSIPTSARAWAAASNGAPGTNRDSPGPLAPFMDRFVEPVAKPVRVIGGVQPCPVEPHRRVWVRPDASARHMWNVLVAATPFSDLNPFLAGVNVDLNAVDRVRMACRNEAPLGDGDQAPDDGADHLLEVVATQGGSD